MSLLSNKSIEYPIFSIFELDNQGLPTYAYIFYNQEYIPDNTNLSSLYKKYKNDKNNNDELTLLKELHMQLDELNKLDSNHIFFINTPIYYDDTMQTISLKLYKELKKESINAIVPEEMYLFGKINKIQYASNVFNTLSLNDSQLISHNKLFAYISNFPDVHMPNETKSHYTFEDILNLNIDGIQPQYFSAGQNTYDDLGIIQSYNPYSNYLTTINNPNYHNNKNNTNEDQYEPFIYSTVASVSNYKLENTFIAPNPNNQLLFNSGELINNTLYLCNARNYMETVPLHNKSLMYRLFFPQLYNHWLIKEQEFGQEQGQDNIKIDVTKFKESANIQLSILDKQLPIKKNIIKNINNQLWGITNMTVSMNVSILQTNTIKLPINDIFKRFNTTEIVPLLKYKPVSIRNISVSSSNKYKIRTFKSNDITDSKIPTISKKTLINIMRINTLSNSLFFYVHLDSKENPDNIMMYCVLHETGNFDIYTYYKEGVSLERVNNDIVKYANPILKQCSDILKNVGLELILFHSFDETPCNVKYTLTTELDNLNKLSWKISPKYNNYFINTLSNELIYIHVDNFNKTESINQYILCYLKENRHNYLFNSIINNIIKNTSINFNISIDYATTLCNDIILAVNANDAGMYSQCISMNSLPSQLGFYVSSAKVNDKLNVSIDNINSLNYLHFLPNYLLNSLYDSQEKITHKAIINDDIVQEEVVIMNMETKIDNNVNKLDELLNEMDYVDDGVNNVISELDNEVENDNLQVLENDDLLMFMGDGNGDGDEEEEDEDEEEDDDLMIGGDKDNSRNYFQNRIFEKEPFLKDSNYSKKCQSNSGRQPVVLSKAEYEQHVKEGLLPEGNNQSVLSWGTNEINYYTCPQYWSFKENKIIDPKDIHKYKNNMYISGPITDTKYVYDFKRQGPLDPGFVSLNEKDTKCMPCCFKNIHTSTKQKIITQCKNKYKNKFAENI